MMKILSYLILEDIWFRGPVISDVRGVLRCPRAGEGAIGLKNDNSPPNQVIDMIRRQRARRHDAAGFIRNALMQTCKHANGARQ